MDATEVVNGGMSCSPPTSYHIRDYNNDRTGFDLSTIRPPLDGDCGWADLLLFGSDPAPVHRQKRRPEHAEDASSSASSDGVAHSLDPGISFKLVNRTQTLSNFLHAHSLSPKHAVGLNSYLTALPTMDLSMPLLQATVDVLCYASWPNCQAQVESRASYAKALALLQTEVERPPYRKERQRPVLVSMMMLCLYELSAGKGDGWATHLNGAQIYLQACGPEILTAPMDLLLFHNLRLCALCLGLYEHKAVLLASPEWMEIASHYSSRNWKGVLFDLAITIPGLIQECDALPNDEVAPQDLCDRLGAAKRDLETWLSHKSSEEGRYKVVHVGAMDRFVALLSDSTFLAVFRFRAIETFRLYGLFWICCALLDVAMLKILDATSSIDMRFGPTTRSRGEIESQLFVFATNLCRSIPYCFTYAPEFTTWYLMFGEKFLGHCDSAHRELKWCQRLHEALERMRRRNKDDGDRTFRDEVTVRIPQNLNKVDPVFMICSQASDNPLT